MKNVLITGGSSGIGLALSRHFARAGYRLLWISLAESELLAAKQMLETEIPGVEIFTLEKDLCYPSACQEVMDWITGSNRTVDVLVNNAGIGTHGFCNDILLGKELKMIQLNVLALYKLTRLFLTEMVDRDSGTIINISSNSSFLPIPRMNTYAATKAFVTHFSKGLQEELELTKSNVKVITVCPAAIADTPFRITHQMDKVKTFDGLATTTAKEVANDIWNGFQKEKTFIISGFKMRMFYRLRPLMPVWLEKYLARRETEIR